MLFLAKPSCTFLIILALSIIVIYTTIRSHLNHHIVAAAMRNMYLFILTLYVIVIYTTIRNHLNHPIATAAMKKLYYKNAFLSFPANTMSPPTYTTLPCTPTSRAHLPPSTSPCTSKPSSKPMAWILDSPTTLHSFLILSIHPFLRNLGMASLFTFLCLSLTSLKTVS
ncbi:hypothetical protein Adt_45478 [Abeliophyllum distichum]|uniref:NADH dehydrogenase subunit 6 n=1 Tax=Abeliophyllum distichum TaxID=126358 RepID=A0ABD1PDU2_9LAMI